MGFLKWLFNVTSRHTKEALLYDKSGTLAKLGFMLFMAVLTGATIGCEFWMLYAFGANLVYGLVIMCVYLTLLSVTCEYSLMFSVFGFMSAITGTLESYVNKLKEKRGKRKVEASQITTSDTTQTNTDEEVIVDNVEQKPIKKTHKLLDVLVGLCGVVFGIGNVIFAILKLITQI